MTATIAPATRAAKNPVTVPPRPIKARRRPYLAALGVVLVILGALAMVYVTATLGQTRAVLAVTNEVSRGQVIQATDLVAVDMPTGPTSLKPVSSDDLDSVVGQVATADLLPGSLLTSGSYTKELEPAAGTSIVGISLNSTQMPTTGLHAGDQVRIVGVPADGADLTDDAMDITATVISVNNGMLNEQVVVNVEADSDEATTLAVWSASNRAVLVIDEIGK